MVIVGLVVTLNSVFGIIPKVIFADQKVFKNNNLFIPHPRAQERDFVLYPLFDINPFFRHPVSKLTVKQLIEQLKDTYIVKRLSYRNLL